jgi:hypothetical protein
MFLVLVAIQETSYESGTVSAYICKEKFMRPAIIMYEQHLNLRSVRAYSHNGYIFIVCHIITSYLEKAAE